MWLFLHEAHPLSLPGDKGPHAYSCITSVQLDLWSLAEIVLISTGLLASLFIFIYLIQSLQTSFRQILFYAQGFPFSVLGFMWNFVNFG